MILLILLAVVVVGLISCVVLAIIDHYLFVTPRLLNRAKADLKQGFSAGKIEAAGKFDAIVIGEYNSVRI